MKDTLNICTTITPPYWQKADAQELLVCGINIYNITSDIPPSTGEWKRSLARAQGAFINSGNSKHKAKPLGRRVTVPQYQIIL